MKRLFYVLTLIVGLSAFAAEESKPTLPDDVRELALTANKHFEEKRYSEAEKIYQEILNKYPDNVYALSCIAVTQIRCVKPAVAEENLKKAIKISPADGFSHTTLGFIYYRQDRYKEAFEILSRAVKLDPKRALAHQYLGLVALRLGYTEIAKREMVEAALSDADFDSSEAKPPPLGDFPTSKEKKQLDNPT
jgi:predicted Zn-dependent protease